MQGVSWAMMLKSVAGDECNHKEADSSLMCMCIERVCIDYISQM
jgi:hypothetical protein